RGIREVQQHGKETLQLCNVGSESVGVTGITSEEIFTGRQGAFLCSFKDISPISYLIGTPAVTS
ncbi:hypothetical protein AMECASPLE_025765, partial [Ameca splendens]